ncbi:MAG: polyphosphate kinase 2 family protein [Planctomycetota bacterium]
MSDYSPLVKKTLIKPGTRVKLKDLPTDAKDATLDKSAAKEQTKANLEQLAELQELLYADGRHALLVLLQAMDAGGKDSTIRRIFSSVNPQGCRVTSFKVPTPLERAHDFLWRHHREMPAKGMIRIHNRSHYETVLVERVKNIVPKSVWQRRYEQIATFESMLASEGTTIVKIYLHLSKDEQKERLLDRQQRPEKHWKFNPSDLEERELWDDYQVAFEDALSKTSIKEASWFAVPADQKWYRDLIISDLIVGKLKSLDLRYPDAPEGIEKYDIT